MELRGRRAKKPQSGLFSYYGNPANLFSQIPFSLCNPGADVVC